MAVAQRRGRLPRKAFLAQFGFNPVEGVGMLREVERDLERTIVAQELLTLWRAIERCETELRQRDPPSWMAQRSPRMVPNRKELHVLLPVLQKRYANAERLARVFNLHPEQHPQS